MTGDRIFGAVMVLVALGFVLSATTIQTPLFPDPMGPKLFPYIIGCGMGLCGLIIALRPDPDADWPDLRTALSLGFATLVMVAYAYLLKPAGFLVPTALAAGILSYMLSPRKTPAILTGLGLSIGLFIVFKYALGLGLQPVPKGWF